MHGDIESNINVRSFTLARVRVHGQALESNACVRVCDVVLNHLRNMPLLQTCTLSTCNCYYRMIVSPLSLDKLNGRTPEHGAELSRDFLHTHTLVSWRAKDASKSAPPINQICPCSQLLVI